MGSALEDLANSPDPQPAQSGSALEALANGPDPTPAKPGFFGTLGTDLKNMVTGIGAGNGDTGPDYSGRVGAAVKLNDQQNAQQVAEDKARKDAGYSDTYTAIAPVAEGLGVNVKGMEQSAKEGNAAAVLGHAAAVPAAMAITAGAVKGIPFVGKSAISAAKTLSDVPAAVSADTGSTLAAVADREGLPPLQAETAREAAEELHKSFVDRAKTQYQVVDKAVDGDLKPVQEKITALKKAIRVQSNVNPDLADKYIDDLATQQKTLQTLIQKAKANGVPNAQELMDAGDKDYAKGMAMKKVSGGIKTASGVVKSGGHPNPTLFANQVDRLYNTGTLERAIGPEGAKALQDVAKNGLSKAKTVSNLKKAALVVGSAAVGGATYETTKALSGH